MYCIVCTDIKSDKLSRDFFQNFNLEIFLTIKTGDYHSQKQKTNKKVFFIISNKTSRFIADVENTFEIVYITSIEKNSELNGSQWSTVFLFRFCLMLLNDHLPFY